MSDGEPVFDLSARSSDQSDPHKTARMRMDQRLEACRLIGCRRVKTSASHRR